MASSLRRRVTLVGESPAGKRPRRVEERARVCVAVSGRPALSRALVPGVGPFWGRSSLALGRSGSGAPCPVPGVLRATTTPFCAGGDGSAISGDNLNDRDGFTRRNCVTNRWTGRPARTCRRDHGPGPNLEDGNRRYPSSLVAHFFVAGACEGTGVPVSVVWGWTGSRTGCLGP